MEIIFCYFRKWFTFTCHGVPSLEVVVEFSRHGFVLTYWTGFPPLQQRETFSVI